MVQGECRRSETAFDESDHPRDEDGKFASGGGSKSKSAGETKKRKEVVLGKKEYAVVMSAINAQYKANFQGRAGKTCGAFVRDFYYQFLNRGFNNYQFHARIPIKGNEDLISVMEAKLK